MHTSPTVRAAFVAAGLAALLAAGACGRRSGWTPISSGMYPAEVDSARIREVDGALEVWVREHYPKSPMHSIRERHTGVRLDCSTDRFRLIDVFVIARNGTRHRDSVVTGAVMYRATPERAADRPWVGTYRLPFSTDEICAQWGPAAARAGT